MDPEGIIATTRRPPRLAILLLTLSLAPGCADTSAPEGPSVLSAWEGRLGPVVSVDPDWAFPLITGNIAALVRQSGTEVGIGLQPFEDADLNLDWGLHSGRCELPGDLLGVPADYAALSESQLEATSFLEEQLVEGEPYYVTVTDAESGTEVACGNLSRTEL